MNENPTVSVFNEDELIIREGDICREMYKVIHGKASIYVNYGKENEYLLGIVGEQKCSGEVSMFSGKPCPYTVKAVDKIMIMRISSDNFDSFLSENTRNISDIMKNMANTIIMLGMNVKMITEELKPISEKLEQIEKSDNSENITKDPVFVDITEKIRKLRAYSTFKEMHTIGTA